MTYFSQTEYEKSLLSIIDDYNARIDGLSSMVKQEKRKGRKIGGVLRSFTGKMTEDITESLVLAALIHRAGIHPSRIAIDKKRVRIPIVENYTPIETNENFKQTFSSIRNSIYFGASVDKHIWIDGELRCGIECKAYAENAMLKRILVDFQLLRTVYPSMVPFLFQLENFLGGDYGKCEQYCYGSDSTHTLLSHFSDIPLRIVTLLEGDRVVDKPFYYDPKPLLYSNLDNAACRILRSLGMENNFVKNISESADSLEGFLV